MSGDTELLEEGQVEEGAQAGEEIPAGEEAVQVQQEEESTYEDAFLEFSEKRKKGEPINPLPDPLPKEEGEGTPAAAGEGETATPEVDPELAAYRESHPQFKALDDAMLASIKAMDDNAKLMEQRFKSVDGRLMPMQRKVNELIKENNRIRSAQQASRVSSADSETWKKFTKDYPDIAKAVEARYGSSAGPMPEVEQISNRLSNLERSELEKRRAAEYAALKEAHADFEHVVNSSKFQTWLFNQPEPVQNLIKSKRAADAAWLISTFKEHAGLAGTGKKPDPQNNQQQGAKVDVKAIQQKREKQLVRGRSIGSKPVGHVATGSDVGGFEAAFRHFSAERDKKRRSQGDRYF